MERERTDLGFRFTRSCATLMWLLSVLFAGRVVGQAVQRWMPQSFMAPFHMFQGSTLPYSLILSAQVIILAVMMRLSWRVQSGALPASRRSGVALAWVGGIYMIGSLARLVIGLALPAAPAWFVTWIPGVFHVVLAGFVLTLAVYHLQQSHLGQDQQ